MNDDLLKLIKRQKLDTSKKSELIRFIETQLKENVVGQQESSELISESISRAIAGIRNRNKPILNFLFLGTTGVGKTQTVKILADIIFGSPEAFTRIDCEELGSEHSFAKLVGSPPGYVGNEIEAMLSQKVIDSHFIKAHKMRLGLFSSENSLSKSYKDKKNECLSIILFDEIEKAHPKIWNSLIGLMDDGHLSLANNKVVNMRNSIIIMTSNVGSQELDKSNAVGFNIETGIKDEHIEYEKMKNNAIKCAKDLFPPEFCNRFDSIIAFKRLSAEDFRKILDLNLQLIYNRLSDINMNFFISYKKEFLDMILERGVDMRYGARNLNRVIDRELITPFSKLINTEQLISGDIVEISYKNNETIFTREPRYTKDVLEHSKKDKNND